MNWSRVVVLSLFVRMQVPSYLNFSHRSVGFLIVNPTVEVGHNVCAKYLAVVKICYAPVLQL